ncbi:transposase family protein [Streptomyces sp. NPDC001351]|uniref:transposase family protein n=1 Tax=Streptomyces sp. NPDC001351 TaxID=3364564 RepID=UPI00369BC96F
MPRCPGCRGRARRVHSSYGRGPAEGPVAGRKLQIGLQARRFHCHRSSYTKKAFVERSTPSSGATRHQPIKSPTWDETAGRNDLSVG